MMQAQHSYNTRHNSQALTEMSENPETNPTPCETSDLILKFENTMLSRFDGLDKEISNIKDIVIKELQLQNQLLRKKVSDLQKKVILLKKIRTIRQTKQYRNHRYPGKRRRSKIGRNCC